MKQTKINLSNAHLTDLDRVIALQCVQCFADHFNIPIDQEHLEPLTLAFGNGVAYARQFDTPQKREQLQKLYQPLINDIFPPQKNNSI